jgi:hypothetical protein
MIVLAAVFVVLGVFGIVAGITWRDLILTMASVGLLFYGIAGVISETSPSPDCSKVYNPDGSYVETCEYPGDE